MDHHQILKSKHEMFGMRVEGSVSGIRAAIVAVLVPSPVREEAPRTSFKVEFGADPPPFPWTHKLTKQALRNHPGHKSPQFKLHRA